MPRAICGLAAALLLLASATPLLAQHYPQKREGLWAGFGVAFGPTRLDCDSGCARLDTGQKGAMMLLLAGGFAADQHLVVAAEVGAWGQPGLGVRLGYAVLGLHVYPWAVAGLFLRAAAGAGFYWEQGGPDAITTSATGRSVVVGIGYDLRMDRNLSLTPYATAVFGRPGDAILVGIREFRGLNFNALQFGAGLTFH